MLDLIHQCFDYANIATNYFRLYMHISVGYSYFSLATEKLGSCDRNGNSHRNFVRRRGCCAEQIHIIPGTQSTHP